MPRRLLALVAVALAWSCTPSPLSEARQTAIADSVKAISAAWRTAAERADAPAIIGYYTPDAAVVSATTLDQTSAAFDRFSSTLASNLEGTRSQTLNYSDQRYTLLGPDAVAETAVGMWLSTNDSGRTDTTHFAYTRAWARRDGTWKILHSHLANVPLPTPSPVRR